VKQGYIMMHGQKNIKIIDYWDELRKENASCRSLLHKLKKLFCTLGAP